MNYNESKKGAKRKRVSLTIANKLKVIELTEKGEISGKKIAEQFGISRQTVSDIKRQKGALLAYALKYDVTNDGSSAAKRQTLRKPNEAMLEEAVFKWYTQQCSKDVNVSGTDLQKIAEKFAKQLELNNFSCSTGWLWRFKQRHNISTKKISEKPKNDIKSMEQFKKTFKNALEESNVSHSQIYNVDEIELLWRALSKNYKNEEKSNGNDKLSVLLCANAEGTHKLKSVVIGKFKNPPALKDCMDILPVIYYHSNIGCATLDIIKNWFYNVFIPEVEKYQREVLKISEDQIKAFLIIDSSLAYNLEYLNDNSRIKCFIMPTNTFLKQPMENGVVMACKKNYEGKFLNELLTDVEMYEEFSTEKEQIEPYNIRSAIINWASAWDDIESEILVECWQNFFQDPNFVKCFEDTQDTIETDEDSRNQSNDKDCTKIDEDGQRRQLVQDESPLDAKDPLAEKEAIVDPIDEESKLAVKEELLKNAREGIDAVIAYVKSSENLELQKYYEQLVSVKEIIFKEEQQSSTCTGAFESVLLPSTSVDIDSFIKSEQ